MLSKEEIADYNQCLKDENKETLKKKADEALEDAEMDFIKFEDYLKKGECYICGQKISHFSLKEEKVCMHWLLNPKGFKTKYFPKLFNVKGYHDIDGYLRWVANTEKKISNINNLISEKSNTKTIEHTIKYKNITWSFSASESDMVGHAGSKNADFPHYHFQMKIDGKVIIKYNAYHIPFSHHDKWMFSLINGDFNNLRFSHIQGAGMQELFDNIPADEMLDMMTGHYSNSREKNDSLNIQTFLMADDGTTISGYEINEAMAESERTGKPIAKTIQRIKNASIQTYITPGKSVPDIEKRKGGRGKK